MALRILYGRSGYGKSTKLYQDMIEQACKNIQNQYIAVVPEQFTMQTQKNIVQAHPNRGVMNIDIVSFERLAYRVFEELGKSEWNILDDTGKSLILRKVVEDKKESLGYFQNKIHMPGFIEEMKSVLSEFFQYGVYEEKLESMLKAGQSKPLLYEKLKDIQILYKGFREYLKDNTIASEELLEVLCGVVSQSNKMKDSIISFDGFTGFTPVQYKLLELLMMYAKDIWVTITMDEDIHSARKEHDLFYMSYRMAYKLKEAAKQAGICVVEEQITYNKDENRFQSMDLLHIERHIFQNPAEKENEGKNDIEIICEGNPAREAWKIVEMLQNLVRTEHYRYRDIAVITGDMESYHRVLWDAFYANHIPCFIDHKRNIIHNPFVQFIQSSLETIDKDFAYESVFHFLKCGMLCIPQDEIDLLENYVLATGMKGFNRWNREFTKTYPELEGENLEQPLTQLNAIREKVVELFKDLRKVCKSKKSTVKDRVEAIYHFIVENKMQQKLKQMEEQFVNSDEQSMAKEYSQTYEKVIGLLDEIVNLMGDKIIPFREFRDILSAGFREIKVGIIPPSVDCVLVGDMERTRLNNVKVLFVAGVNDGIIPKAGGKGGILSETERVFFKESQIELAPTARENAFTQRFYLYLNLTKASDKLILSYSQTSQGGMALRPSYLIENICQLFFQVANEMEDDKEREDNVYQMASVCAAQQYLARGIRSFGDWGNSAPKLWRELYTYYFKTARDKITKMVEEAYKREEGFALDEAVAKALYGNYMQASVTRLEKFASCAYAHFLTYGLALMPRREYQIEAAQLGSLYHKSIEKFSEKVKKSGLQWRDITEPIRKKMVREVVEELVHDMGNTAFLDNARNAYLLERVERITNRTIWALCHQLGRSKLVPAHYEFSFSTGENAPGARIQLEDDTVMDLRGVVDRVDLYKEDSNLYVKIIDYKTGNTKFDILDAYYGIQMQLVVYLDAMMEVEKEHHPGYQVIPAGIFYYNVKDPFIDLKDGQEWEGESDLKEFKMSGLVNAEQDVISCMSDDLNENDGGMPIFLNKNGTLSKKSSQATPQQIDTLIQYVRGQCNQYTKQMVNGVIEKNPFQQGDNHSCTYCSYHGVCKFDDTQREYRHLEKLASEEVWGKMGQAVEQKREGKDKKEKI